MAEHIPIFQGKAAKYHKAVLKALYTREPQSSPWYLAKEVVYLLGRKESESLHGVYSVLIRKNGRLDTLEKYGYIYSNPQEIGIHWKGIWALLVDKPNTLNNIHPNILMELKQGVQAESDERRGGSDPGDPHASEKRKGTREEGQRSNHEAEQGQARHGLDSVYQFENRFTASFGTGGLDARRHPDEDGGSHGCQAETHVMQQFTEEFFPVVGKLQQYGCVFEQSEENKYGKNQERHDEGEPPHQRRAGLPITETEKEIEGQNEKPETPGETDPSEAARVPIVDRSVKIPYPPENQKHEKPCRSQKRDGISPAAQNQKKYYSDEDEPGDDEQGVEFEKPDFLSGDYPVLLDRRHRQRESENGT